MTNEMNDIADQSATTTQILSDEELGAVDGGTLLLGTVFGLAPLENTMLTTVASQLVAGLGPGGPAVMVSDPPAAKPA